MIASMTGFGRGQAQSDNLVIIVEARSVNSRYCEVSTRLPRQLAEYENAIQNLVKQALTRGRVNLQFQIESAGDAGAPVQVNPDTVKTYHRMLNQIREIADIQTPVSLSDLLTFPDIITSLDESTEANEATWLAIKEAVEKALDNLKAMRVQEGKALKKDLEERIAKIAEGLEQVELRAPERIEESRVKLHDRLKELFEDERIDRDRIEIEIALIADRLDVTEECVRLHSHLQLFHDALQSAEPVGRKLNFITQEINREINTIGSKANDKKVAHLVVGMKEELEKIREQIQNIE